MPANPLRRINDVSTLHPLVRQKVQAVQARLEAEGIPLRAFESFRTPQRQSDLYAQGRTKPGKKVTKAEAWESYHQYGCAVDFVFFENGQWHWGENGQHRQWYSRLHEIARENGLEPLSWETPHLQLMGKTTADLMAGRYPAGGDDAWADSLNGMIDSWTGSFKPPRATVSEPQRPGLNEEGVPIARVVKFPPGTGDNGTGGRGATDIPRPDTFNLCSRLFSGNFALEAVADGHRLLRATGSRVEGIELVQDALNRLAVHAPEYRVETGPHRGFFGQKTARAISAFQDDFRLLVDGEVGQETIKALDAAMVKLEQGQIFETPAIILAGGGNTHGYQPPLVNASLLAGVDFSAANASTGAPLRAAYAEADRTKYDGDPSNCKALLQFPRHKAVYFEAKMAICADGSPRAVEIDPPYGLTRTACKFPVGRKGNFNAEHVPYIVLPGKSEDGRFDFVKTFGLGKLDCGVVIHGGRVTPAFYGEVGPVFRLGEASIKVHESLPVPFPWTSNARTKVRNSSVGGAVLYLLFPGSAVAAGTHSEDSWLQATLDKAMQLFQGFIATGGK